MLVCILKTSCHLLCIIIDVRGERIWQSWKFLCFVSHSPFANSTVSTTRPSQGVCVSPSISTVPLLSSQHLQTASPLSPPDGFGRQLSYCLSLERWSRGAALCPSRRLSPHWAPGPVTHPGKRSPCQSEVKVPLEKERERESHPCATRLSACLSNPSKGFSPVNNTEGARGGEREKAKETRVHTAQANMDEQEPLIGAAKMPL